MAGPRLALVIALWMLLAATAHATPPSVLHAPSDDGIPHTTDFQIGSDGSHTLNLWLATGPAPTPMVSDQEVCKNGVGDESCGIYAVVRTTGGVTITSFSPSPGVSANELSPSELRIVRLSAAEPNVGDLGTVRLGTLTVNRSGDGEVILSSSSSYVRADLVLESLAEEPIAVPEPEQWLLLVSALALLALLHRLRLRAGLVALVATGVTSLAFSEASAQSTVGYFVDRSSFQAALAEELESEDFESVPLDGNGFGAASNGASFGGGAFTWTSSATAVDIDLFASAAEGGGDTGLDGTVLFSQIPGLPSVVAQPGGNSAGPPGQSDAFVLSFDPPVQAVGMELYEVTGGFYGARMKFKDESGAVICNYDLTFPGGIADAFRGCFAPPGMTIAEVSFSNGGLFGPNGHVYFDDVFWAAPSIYAIDPDFAPDPKVRAWRQLGPDELGVGPDGLEAGDFYGYGAANVGDLNGDGLVDLAVGAPADDTGGSNRGALYLFFLERDGGVRGEPKTINALEGGLPGSLLQDEDRFGRSVAGLGDLDGDSVPDLVVGADAQADNGETGQVFVLFMTRDGTVKDVQAINASEGGFTGGIAADDEFGNSVTTLGDLDGDGVVDIAVGARLDDDGGSDTGAVWILFLNDDGTVKAHQKISATSGGLTGPLATGDEFGFSLAPLGDLDRDGVRDLAVGAWLDDTGGSNRGAVWILFLNDDGTVKSEVKLHNDGTTGVPFGSFAWGGFLLGGAADDDRAGASLGWIPTPSLPTPGVLAVGVPRFETTLPISGIMDEGSVFFLALDPDGSIVRQSGLARTVPPAGIPVPGAFDPPSGESHRFASSIAPLGDLDGDAFPDVFLGAREADFPGESDAGAGYVVFLSGFDPTAYADAVNNVFNGCTCNTSPFGFNCADSRIVGPPDGIGAVLRDGDSITVEFYDNEPRADGTAQGDVVLHRKLNFGLFGSNDVLVEARTATSAAWVTVFNGSAAKDQEQVPVDLDSGFTPGTAIRYLRITVTDACTDACTVFGCDDPFWDAVEAANNANFLFDADLDFVVDGNDTCRYQVNPTQTDSDGDGVGDICDNCPAVSNEDQLDGDGDGFGDICDDGELRLVDISQSPPEWELRYRCPGDDSRLELNVGIVIPASVDPASVRFGSSSAATACEEPVANVIIPNPPLGYVPGIGCNLAPDIGETVSGDLSGVIGPGLISPSGVRSDTLYVTARGFGLGDPLCTANQDVGIGRLFFDAPPGGSIGIPALTARGVDTPGLELPDSRPARSKRINPQVSTVDLRLAAVPGQTPGAETEWEARVQADGQINRLSFGLLPPVGTSTADMTWVGCTNGPSAPPELRRTCSSFLSQYGNVAPTTSCGGSPCPAYSQGPDDLTQDPIMHVVLEGTVTANDPTLKTLNPAATAETPVGRVSLIGAPGIAPELTLDGLENLPSQPALLAAVDSNFDGIPDLEAEISTLDVTFATAAASSEDTDQDSLSDDNDNCPFLANTNQTNTGGLGDSVGTDFIGDDCQCGDLDFDGRILPGGPDLDILVDVLLGVNTSPAVLNRASVVDGTTATLRDAVFLQLGLDGKDPGISQSCEDGVLPVP